MAVAFESIGAGQTGNISSFSFSHTIAGSNRSCYVILGTRTSTGSSVTVGSTTCSLVASISFSSSNDHRVEIWETDSQPATGAQTVSGSMSAMQQSCVQSINFTGVDQATPSDDAQTASGAAVTTLNATHTLHSADSMILAAVVTTQSPAPGANETERDELLQAGNDLGIYTQDGADGGSIDPTWASADAVLASINVRPSAGVGIPIVMHHRTKNFGVS